MSVLRWNYFVLRIMISRIPCGMSLRMPSELLHYVVKYVWPSGKTSRKSLGLVTCKHTTKPKMCHSVEYEILLPCVTLKPQLHNP